MKILRLAILAPFALLVCGFFQAPQIQDGRRILKPIMVLYGNDSQISKPKLVRITNAKEWKTLWMEHQFGPSKEDDRPDVDFDFDRVTVIALFDGDSIVGRFDFHSVSEQQAKITVRVERPHGQVFFVCVDPSSQVRVGTFSKARSSNKPNRPWVILALPKSNKEIVLEQNNQDMIGDPPKWETWITFPAIQDRPVGK